MRNIINFLKYHNGTVAIFLALFFGITAFAATGNVFIGAGTGNSARATSTIQMLTNSNVGISTSTPWGVLSVHAPFMRDEGTPIFVVGSTTPDGSNNTLFIVDSAGKVTIGSYVNSGETLDVVGSFAVETPQGTDNFIVTAGALVGIGTSSPLSKLAVSQTTGTNNIFQVSSSTIETPVLTLDSDGVMMDKRGIYCELYNGENQVAQSIANGTGYVQSTALASTTVTETKYCKPLTTSSHIAITKSGTYRVNGLFSFGNITGSARFMGAAFVDGVKQNNTEFMISGSSTLQTVGFTGFIYSTSSSILDVRFIHDQAGAQNVTIQHGNLNVEYVGGI